MTRGMLQSALRLNFFFGYIFAEKTAAGSDLNWLMKTEAMMPTENL